MAKNPLHNLSRATLFDMVKTHERHGYISLASLSSWNRVYDRQPKKNEFACKKQYDVIEETIIKSDLEEELTEHLLNTVDILKKNRTDK
ncbi:hypothetical protein GNP73_08255 [Aliivibrio fischeri]|uniref:hypothetical protein n=1 Tax=Aliivibrio fischeri TaxID=668 RepID=UPI0012DA05D8|nr:hypothetical protein [Aliivibrio fischeri]MUJ27965.1 hypothetical protein [Aliivibrio fischeri]